MEIIKEKKKLEDAGWIIGFLLGYFLLTTVIFFVFKYRMHFGNLTYLKSMFFPFAIIIISRGIKKMIN